MAGFVCVFSRFFAVQKSPRISSMITVADSNSSPRTLIWRLADRCKDLLCPTDVLMGGSGTPQNASAPVMMCRPRCHGSFATRNRYDNDPANWLQVLHPFRNSPPARGCLTPVGESSSRGSELSNSLFLGADLTTNEGMFVFPALLPFPTN